MKMFSNKENKKFTRSSGKTSKCDVRGCPRNVKSSIHKLPKNPKLRNEWIHKLKLCSGNAEPFFVCGEHFQPDDYCKGSPETSRRPQRHLSKSAVPSVNLPTDHCPNCSESMYTNVSEGSDDLMLDENDIESAIKTDWTEDLPENSNLNGDESIMDGEFTNANELIIEIDWSSENEEITDQENYFFAKAESMSKKYYQTSISTQTNFSCRDKCIQTNLAYDEALKPLSLLNMLHNDSDLESWTGIPTFLTLNNIVKCVNQISAAYDQLRKFNATTELLTVFVMTKLKTNLTFKQLGCLFQLQPRTLSNYFDEYIPILSTALKPAIFWPSTDQVSKNLPKCFVPDFHKCYGVMDCTEFPIERLKTLESRIKTLSHYKGCYTGKINLTITPSGLIVDVSKTYGGKASDKHIVISEKILEHFSANNGVMVDKGYHISKETADKGIHLYQPPILDKPQHSAEEAIYNTNVAGSRIHVERVFQRLKHFNIFRCKMNKSMLRHVDDIVIITCAIANLSSPVLANDKF